MGQYFLDSKYAEIQKISKLKRHHVNNLSSVQLTNVRRTLQQLKSRGVRMEAASPRFP